MTPSTLVRRPRGPMSFVARIAEAMENRPSNKCKPQPKCIVCALPARYIDMQRGGFVCYEHRPEARKAVPA